MATTSAAYTPVLDTLITAPDPTAQWGTPATKLQVQNASPFTLEITCNGEQFTIQSFTAQTMPLDGAGTTVTMLPTSGPAGSQGSITAVWMQKGQSPPMADGQLTGAAQYAQGLGAVILTAGSGLNGIPSGVTQFATAPPNTRTLVLYGSAAGPGSSAPTNVTISQGGIGGAFQYNDPPYITALPASNFVVVLPFYAGYLAGFGIEVTVTGPSVGGYLFVLSADTALYPESTFYNGQAQIATFAGLAGSHVLLDGPARLLSLSIDTLGAGEAYVSTSASQRLLQVNVQGTASIGFPPNTLLAAGQTLTFVNAVTAACNLVYAYP